MVSWGVDRGSVGGGEGGGDRTAPSQKGLRKPSWRSDWRILGMGRCGSWFCVAMLLLRSAPDARCEVEVSGRSLAVQFGRSRSPPPCVEVRGRSAAAARASLST